MGKFVDIFGKLQADLSSEYLKNAMIMACVFGVVFFALILVVAIKYKKARGFGITTAIFQLLGAIGAALYVKGFHTLELVQKGVGSTEEEALKNLGDAVTSALIDMIPFFVGSILILLAWIFGLIYIVKIKSECLKVLGIFALILQILRYVFISPISFSGMFSGGMTEAAQASQDKVYFIACLIPLLFIFVGALVGNRNKPEATIAVEGTAVEAPVVEAAVVEEAVVEAPAAEEVAAEAPAEEAVVEAPAAAEAPAEATQE